MEFEILAEANAVPKSAFPVIIWSSRNFVNSCHVIFQKLGEKLVIQKAENGTDHWSFFFFFHITCAVHMLTASSQTDPAILAQTSTCPW